MGCGAILALASGPLGMFLLLEGKYVIASLVCHSIGLCLGVLCYWYTKETEVIDTAAYRVDVRTLLFWSILLNIAGGALAAVSLFGGLPP
jgi:hypothetical protein